MTRADAINSSTNRKNYIAFKPLGVPILLSDSVVAQIPGALQLGPPTEAPLKGKAAATVLYPCLGFVEPDTIFLVQSSFARIAERAEEFAPRFYANLFEVHPELRLLFRDDLAAQTKMFMYILSSAVRGLNRMQEMVGGLRALLTDGIGDRVATADAIACCLIRPHASALAPSLRDILTVNRPS